MSTPSITVSANGIVLHKDIESDLFNHDFEFSMHDDIEEYIIDFLDTYVIPYTFKKREGKTEYFFDVLAFSGELEMKYDNDDNLYY